MIKITGRQKNDSSVTRKVTQRLIIQKAIRKTERKREAISISLEIANPVNKASLTWAS